MLHVDAVANEDPYLAELRRALVDPEPLGPRDDVPTSDEDDLAFFDQERVEQQRWGTARRRRR